MHNVKHAVGANLNNNNNNIFIRDVEIHIKSLLINVVGDPKTVAVVNNEDRTVIQIALDHLVNGGHSNKMCFRIAKCKAKHLRTRNAGHAYRMRDLIPERSDSEKDLRSQWTNT